MDALINACAVRFSDAEMALLERAMEIANKAHGKQKRESGEPYITHPIAVALMLLEMGMDPNTVIAGLLHDVVEDGENITVDMLRSIFGEDIAGMVDGVTKLTKTGKSELLSQEEAQAENLRKMFLAIAKDVRVVIIKLTDRLHNMRTLEYCTPEKRMRKARETLDVYAPLADRFGMGAIKCELEDLCFKYIWPDEYSQLKKQIEPQQRERMRTLDIAINTIKAQLADVGIEAQINGRPKHLYSIYKKVQRQSRALSEIYDLIAVRVVVNTINDCYAALGVIHAIWRPVPGRFKDYIAMPKTNMYRSLHTTLFAETGMPFEVQIRTFEMHRTSEYGIAAHWMYKEGRAEQDDLDSKLAWLREALELENYADNTREFVENIRKDFFSDYVYVLTPRGQIIDLVAGSTPLDFAYRIHSNVGNHAQHAKVNGAIVRLDYKLKNNDVVEIVTAPGATPSRDWLKLVKTQQAKAKIRQWFKKANREENVARGKEMLSDAAKRQGRQLSELT
ncbi:MAG TPA: bifunctional (p)ppGpp synthetase/guanosine-3',5'-bis(diphosphate) 3'-pyrophosphohydrolase, partial [Clostridia bacterium]|nr:bifunctional (p)ppGpp synthetase/guanosine-3',5'-bis(diphosphate) 3'-pyrophosphohydrolase [Clostridia bacterium]